MHNSPTLCQLYVDVALQPLRRQMPHTIIYHYMDDILLAQKEQFTQTQIDFIIRMLAEFSLVVAPEKVQRSAPWRYLGWTITDQRITPQKLDIATEISTLHEAQKLLGDLQWLKPVVGIPNDLLSDLRPLLKGTDPCTPVALDDHQRQSLDKILHRIATGFVARWDSTVPLSLMLWASQQHLLGAIVQTVKKTGEIQVLEWLTPPLQQRRTISPKLLQLASLIKKGRIRTVEISGMEPATIHLPMERDTLDWYLINSAELADALLTSGATVAVAPKALQWIGEWNWIVRPLRREKPIARAITAFTDAGKRSRRAAVVWKVRGKWHQQILEAHPDDSLQTLELLAAVWVMSNIWEPVNLISDSLYVVGFVARIEDASIKEVENKRLLDLFLQLKRAIKDRTNPYSVIHIRSHKWEVGLGEGNARADRLVMASVEQVATSLASAREAHGLFHHNVKGLVRQFNIKMTDAQAIVRACPVCSQHNGGLGLGLGVNPRGLKSNEIWQMDVTHVASFGRLRWVHVTIDTFSGFMWATAQAGEKALYVIRHLTSCFALMGVPRPIKTDNGPAYVGGKVNRFLDTWGVKYITGIPHSPTGQAVIERAHGMLKRYISKMEEQSDIHTKLAKVLYVINYLCVFGEQKEPSAIRHQAGINREAPTEEVWVRYRDPKTGVWQAPAKVLYWGRGYLCVSTPSGTLWVPSQWARPANVPGKHCQPGTEPSAE
uniref:Uncharacterized protein n=1 Tax=Catharus ustulatus TaxID=91951 RepID=A0A8C3UI16_CATUS